MAGSTYNLIALPEVFGPEDAETDVVAIATTGNVAQGGFGGTSGGEDLSGSTINIQQDGAQVLNNLGLIGALAKLVIDLLIALGNWIAGEFQGVPEQAKTIGTGTQLAHSKDPITQWIGLQLAGGGAAGRLLSEGGWPHNFGGHIIAMGGALIEFANREPPSSYWRVRDTPASAIARFHDEARQFRVGPVPPPKGAPYDRPVIIDGFFAQRVLDPAAYKAQFGFDQPTPDQLVQFFDDQRGIMFNHQGGSGGTLAEMRKAFLQFWIDAYKRWLTDNPQPTPGGPPPPPSGTCKDPCELQVIEQLYSIALQINAGNTASMAIMQNLPALLAALRNLSSDRSAAVMQDLVDCACPNLDKIAAALEGGDGTPLHSIMDSLKKLAEGGSGGDGDLKRIADSFAQADAMVPTIRQLKQLLAEQGLMLPSIAQV